MPESNSSSSLHWILGAALLLIGLFVVVALVSVNSQADTVNTQTDVTNNAPTVEDVFINDAAFTFADSYSGGTINTLVAGGQKTIYVNGNARDTNGRGDIKGISTVLYRTAVGDGCSPDSNDCYGVASCGTQNDTEGDLEVLEYSCPINLDYWADSTSAGGTDAGGNWTVKVSVEDNGGEHGTDSSLTKEMQTLLALNIPTSINYGTLTKGQKTTSSNNQTQTMTQQGNDQADVEVSSASDMTCTNTGTIPVANQEWSLTDEDHSHGSMTDLSGSATDTNLAVGYKTAGDVTVDLYWNIELPAQDISGTCTGTTTVTAIAA